MKKNSSDNTQQSIDRALNLLNILSATGSPMTITEISKVLNIARSTVYSMVNTMVAQNYLERDDSTGKYFLGYKVFVLGFTYRFKYYSLFSCDEYLRSYLMQHPIPNLRRSEILVLQPDGIVLLFVAKIPDSPFPIRPIKRMLPFYCTAGGRLLASFKDEETVEYFFERTELKKYTSSTLTDKDKILAQFPQIREQGYAIEYEEYTPYETNLAAPIKDLSDQVTACINFVFTKSDFAERKEQYIEEIVTLAQELSTTMGYN